MDWRHIRHGKDTERYAISGKRGRRKTAKKKKRKPTPSREECELARITEARRRKAKLKDCPTSLAERSVKVLPEKIMPAGRHFRWSNGAAA